MKEKKLRVIHADADWSTLDERTELYSFEARVGSDVVLMPNVKHPGGFVPQDTEALKAAILRGDTRYEEVRTFKTQPPQVVTCRWVILPAPAPESKPFWLFAGHDRRGNVAGVFAALLAIVILAIGTITLWRSGLATWIRVVGTLLAIPFLFIASILSHMFAADLVSRDDMVSRSIRCPTCGKRMRLDKRIDSRDQSSGPDQVVRQSHTTDYFVCRKCGYDRRLN